MIPEIEVFIGKVPIAPYFTPGTPEMGKHVAALVDKHNTILMANHGVVAWSHSVEDAYFKMEIIEAYCRTIVVATQLGTQLKTFTPTQMQDLLNIKQTLDIPDPRIGLKECELCDNNEWRPGVNCALPPNGQAAAHGHDSTAQPDPEAEKVIQAITDQILARMK
jgi:L-fuculose-phosphate aldolase